MESTHKSGVIPTQVPVAIQLTRVTARERQVQQE